MSVAPEGKMHIHGVVDINFNKIARYLDAIEIDATTDPAWVAFVASWASFKTAWIAALAALQAGAGSPAAVVTYATVMQTNLGALLTMPSTITGRVDAGSENVYVG
jgi:hypothetical protein